MQSCVCGDGGAVVCVMAWDICMCVSVCMAGTKRQGGVLLSPLLFWPEGRKPWKWGVERKRKKCHSSSVSVKGI